MSTDTTSHNNNNNNNNNINNNISQTPPPPNKSVGPDHPSGKLPKSNISSSTSTPLNHSFGSDSDPGGFKVTFAEQVLLQRTFSAWRSHTRGNVMANLREVIYPIMSRGM